MDKNQLLGAYEKERTRLGLTHRAFCRTYNIDEETFRLFRISPKVNDPQIMASIIHFIQGVEIETSSWSKEQLLEEYEKRRAVEGFSHKAFCLRMHVKMNTFSSYRNRPHEESRFSREALESYLAHGFPNVPSSSNLSGQSASPNIVQSQERPMKSYVEESIVRIDSWLNLPLPNIKRAIILIDGDQAEGNINHLKTSLMPPEGQALLIIFIRADRFASIGSFWSL